MSVVYRVVILNKPFKIRGFTLLQWCVLVGTAALCFFVCSKFPSEWKLGNIPVGIWVGLAIFSAVIVFVTAAQMKPLVWWKNRIFFSLGLNSRCYLPHTESGPPEYPDPNVIEPSKQEQGIYIE